MLVSGICQNNTGFETRQISLAEKSLSTSIFWQIPLTSMVYFYNNTLKLFKFSMSTVTVQRVQITESMSLLVFRIDGESGS